MNKMFREIVSRKNKNIPSKIEIVLNTKQNFPWKNILRKEKCSREK